MTPELERTLLIEGLEDLIPLPEIAATVRVRRLVDPDSVIQETAHALVALFDRGLIQVWAAPWPAEPQVIGGASARTLLSDHEQYVYNTASDVAHRAYYVNIENLRVELDQA